MYHLKLNVSKNVGTWTSVISIISQRRTALNYQHGCEQTTAQLITLGRSSCCSCPRSTWSQLTTWRFIAGSGSVPNNAENFHLLRYDSSPWAHRGVEIMEETLHTFRCITQETPGTSVEVWIRRFVFSFLPRDGALRCVWSSPACSLLHLYSRYWLDALLCPCFVGAAASFYTMPDSGSRQKCVCTLCE